MKPASIAQEYFVKYKYLSTAFPAVLCRMAGFYINCTALLHRDMLFRYTKINEWGERSYEKDNGCLFYGMSFVVAIGGVGSGFGCGNY